MDMESNTPPAWADARAMGATIRYAGKKSEHPDATHGTRPRTGWRPCDGSADLVRQKKIKRGGGGLVAHRRGGVKGMKITKEKL